MKKKISLSSIIKRLSLIAVLVFGAVIMIAFTPNKAKQGSTETFSWFISKTDGYGVYYDKYEESLPIQWLNNQLWDVENHTLSTNGTGDNVKFSFDVPISGSEKDYLGTMIGSREYADIINLSASTDSPQLLYNDGVLMDLTEYVEAYMPNYVAYMEQNPDVMELATVKDENGKRHYYALYNVSDVPNDNFMGFVYRRDWIVDYADVPSHIWDLENILKDQNDPTSVDASKIHYTYYYDALENNDWTGWIPQTQVQAFTSSEGNDPDNDYVDNVVFPSGKDKPIYISDWEWMFTAFKKALIAEGLDKDPNAYCTTIYFEGALRTGDLYSSFGGGSPLWYVKTNENGQKTTEFGLDSSTMNTYLTAMNTWYKRGWVDTKFDERTNDMFYKINLDNFSQGKVGLQQAGMAYPGTTIRTTHYVGKDKSKAMLLGCCHPVNDLYGPDECKFVKPDSMYSASKLGTPAGISTAAANKNLPALFTVLNWLYSEEGTCLTTYGLNEEQYNSMTFEGDYYKKYNIPTAYTYNAEEGKYYYYEKEDVNLQGALNAQRLTTTLALQNKKGNVYHKALRSAMDEWIYFKNITEITPYTSFMNPEQSAIYNNKNSRIQTHMITNLPNMIKRGVTNSKWKDFTAIAKKYGYEEISAMYNEILKSLS